MNSNKNLLPQYISPFTVLVIFSLLSLVGIAIAPMLPIRLYPTGEGKSIYVSYSYPSASAEAVEMEVTAPLEGLLSLIDGVQRVSSVSGDGWGSIAIVLNRDARTEVIRFRTLSAIREVYPQMPQGVTYPRVNSQSPEKEMTIQLLTYTISSQLPPPVLRSIVDEQLIPPLSVIEGVSSLNVFGANLNDWYVECKPELMHRYNLRIDDIARAIGRQTFLSGVGILQTEDGLSIPLSVASEGIKPNQWDDIEVANINGRVVTLGQIATVELREREPDEYFRINGQTAITLVVKTTNQANQIATANRIFRAIDSIKPTLPNGVSLNKSLDNTTYIRADLRRNFLRTFFSLSVLLLFVFVATRNFRYLMVVSLSLIANLAIALIFYYILKLEIHLYSLSGITLSLGLIIDNTLVMVDHLRHRRNMLVFTAILAATLTTIGALVSIFFLDEAQRINLTDFAWVIMVNLGVSLLIGLFMIPALIQVSDLPSGYRTRRNREMRLRITLSRSYSWLSLKIFKFRKIVLVIGILAVGLPVFLIPDKIEKEGFWPKVFNSTLGTSTYRNSIKPVADKVFGGSLRLFYNSVWKKDFWSTPERTRVYVNATLPQGGTLNHANDLAVLFESHILNHPEVEQVITNVNSRGFNIEIFFTPQYENSSFPFIIKSKAESLAITQAGADFSIYGVGLGFSNAISYGYANSRILLSGYSHRQLMAWARQFADSLKKMPRVDKVWIRGGNAFWFNDEYRRFLSLNEEHLLVAGVSPSRFSSELMRFSPQTDWIQWEPIDGKVSAVRIRYEREEIPSDFEVKNSPVVVGEKNVRTGNIGIFRDELIGDRIYKINQEYIITFAYNYIGPDKLVKIVIDDQVKRMNEVLPTGFTATVPKWSNWQKDDIKQYTLIGLMVLIIFVITSILFESLRQPLAVILLVPLSFIGVFVTYTLFDLSFDQGTYAAFLLLGGLVVNSAIYIINEQNNLRKRYPNASKHSIYIRAVNAKVIPILLTVISTVLGLLPFIFFGKEPFWFSLATGTIGGLLFSIPALLLFLPALPGGMK